MTSEIIPFGKYKGMPIETVANDKKYMDWLLAQDWFKERYANFYTLIINNFTEPEDTPEHNAMQVKFLDNSYIIYLCEKLPILNNTDKVLIKKFEHAGWDVFLRLSSHEIDSIKSVITDIFKSKYCTNDLYYIESSLKPLTSSTKENVDQIAINYIPEFEENFSVIDVYLEVKPTISDDFPSVLRQIKANAKNISRKSLIILLIGEYTGKGADINEFVEYFRNEGIETIFDPIHGKTET